LVESIPSFAGAVGETGGYLFGDAALCLRHHHLAVRPSEIASYPFLSWRNCG
jgi:hypothetical protein